MAADGRSTILATYNQAGAGTFPDNVLREISPADLRAFVEKIVESSRNIVDDSYVFYTVTASGTDTYTATPSPVVLAYASNHVYFIKFTNANTGAATLNLNGLGAKAIKKQGSVALAAGDIAAGQIMILAYDGTNLQLINNNIVDGGTI